MPLCIAAMAALKLNLIINGVSAYGFICLLFVLIFTISRLILSILFIYFLKKIIPGNYENILNCKAYYEKIVSLKCIGCEQYNSYKTKLKNLYKMIDERYKEKYKDYPELSTRIKIPES